MTEHRHYSGPDLAPLLRQVRDELGSGAEIIRAERIRSGGLAGFFAREHYEVVAKRPEVESTAAVEPPVPTDAKPASALDPAAGRSTTDEPVAGPPPTGRSTTDEPVAGPPPTGPVTTDATDVNVTAGRSIQAALLDRADRVSTEELLVRVAETHSADWGSESFQSILGRAMVDAVDPSVGMTSGEERRRGLSHVESGPHRPDHSINGLRLEPVRPDEHVIDPAPQPPPGEPPAEARDAEPVDGVPDPDPSTESAGDGWEGRYDGHGAPPWAGDVPPPWAPPWVPGWAPWAINGKPGQSGGELTWGPVHLLCPNCAGPVVADPTDQAAATPEVGTGEAPEADDPWWELREEINDVRRRLDDIIVTIRQTAEGRGGVDRGSPDTGSEDDVEIVSEDRDRPARRAENNRRNGRTGR